ncbi:MAG: hypothetical protein V4710_09800 [Verrucomicrobiota bacterium]
MQHGFPSFALSAAMLLAFHLHAPAQAPAPPLVKGGERTPLKLKENANDHFL